jgi:hypothetical protein
MDSVLRAAPEEKIPPAIQIDADTAWSEIKDRQEFSAIRRR